MMLPIFTTSPVKKNAQRQRCVNQLKLIQRRLCEYAAGWKHLPSSFCRQRNSAFYENGISV